MSRSMVYISRGLAIGAIFLCVTLYWRSSAIPHPPPLILDTRPAIPTPTVSNYFNTSQKSKTTVDHTDGIHIVEVFPLLQTESWMRQGYNISNTSLIDQREMEYFETLSANILHPFVTEIHLLTDQPNVLLRKLTTKFNVNLEKIHIHQTVPNPTYRDIFKYASDTLQHKLVLILNADNILERGFDTMDTKLFKRRQLIMYALTRHVPLKGCTLGPANYCDGDSYMGSHDGFLFYIRNALPKAFLNELNFPSNYWGSENVVIWAFRRYLRAKVTNPCKRLFLRHNHCSGVRPRGFTRERVNTNGRSGMAYYSY